MISAQAARNHLGIVAGLLAAAGLAWWWTVGRMAGMDAGPGADLGTLGWCIGCSWALMAALFALGVMSLTWMVVIAALVAFEKTSPWPLAARLATAIVLVALAAGILLARTSPRLPSSRVRERRTA